MTVAVFVLSLLGAMALGMPIAYALLACGVALMGYLALIGGLPAFDSQIIAQRFVDGADNFPLLAVPFFLLAGEFMTAGGLSRRIVNMAMAWVGHFRGGMGYVAVVAAIILASISGSAVADTAALAALLIPMMKAAGYQVNRSAGLIAAGGIIAPVIPPSIGMIVFGVAANVSITKLFLAGIVPGILMGLSILIAWRLISRHDKLETRPRPPVAEIRKTFVDGIWALFLPVIIIVGLKLGVFTPTEAAVVAVFYALIVGMFCYKEIKVKDLFPVFKKSVISSAVIMFIIANAGLFSFLITRAGVPEAIGTYLQKTLTSPAMFLLGVNAALFLIGMFLETSASVIVLAPILAPVAIKFGIDPVHFGTIMVVNLAMGMITPPFGVNLFAACTVAKISLDQIVRELIPFVLCVLACLMIITYVPQVSLFLRDLVYGY